MANNEVRFGPFRLDIAKRELLRDGKTVRLGSRACDILSALGAAQGAVVTKDALMAQVWPGQIVEENAIQVQISALRKALDEDGSGQDHIVTVPGGVGPLRTRVVAEQFQRIVAFLQRARFVMDG